MNRQIILIISIAEVADQILELVTSFMDSHKIDMSYREVIFDELVTKVTYFLVGYRPAPQHSFANDYSVLAAEVIGNEISSLLERIITTNITPSNCKLKILVAYKEIVVVKTIY